MTIYYECPENKSATATTRRLLNHNVVSQLDFRSNSALPQMWKHVTTFESAALYLRGRIMSGDNACINCRRGNGRFAKCVVLRSQSEVWPNDFFHGACANCLAGSATKCTLSKSLYPLKVEVRSVSTFKLTLLGSIFKERTSRSSRPPSAPSTLSRQRRLSSVGSSSSSRVQRSGFILPEDQDLSNADDLARRRAQYAHRDQA